MKYYLLWKYSTKYDMGRRPYVTKKFKLSGRNWSDLMLQKNLKCQAEIDLTWEQ